MNTLTHTKTHSTSPRPRNTEFSFENADVKSICPFECPCGTGPPNPQPHPAVVPHLGRFEAPDTAQSGGCPQKALVTCRDTVADCGLRLTHRTEDLAWPGTQKRKKKSIGYFKHKMNSKLSLSSECVETIFCKPCTSFTSHLHSSCGMVWYRTEI